MTPPPWTCPAIDRCAHAIRSARWVVRDGGDPLAYRLAVAKLDEALAALEVVRAENAATMAWANQQPRGSDHE